MTILARLGRHQGGAAAAELALCLPMMMALIFGSMEAGNYMLTEHKVIKGVRDGARYAARQPFTAFDCSSNSVADADVEDAIKAVTRSGQPSGNAKVRVRNWGSNDADVSVTVDCDTTTTTGLYADHGSAPRVRVSTAFAYPSLLGSLGFDTGGIAVRAESQAAVMGL